MFHKRIIIGTLVLLCIISSICFSKLPITKEQRKCIKGRIDYDLSCNPSYLWGGASLKPGAPKDCSGAITAYFSGCGVIKIKRVTSNWMAHGKGGWDFPKIPFKEGKTLDIIFFTFKDKRPQGHVGILVEDVLFNKIGRFAHASYTYGFIVSTIDISDPKNYFGSHFDWLIQTN